MEEGKKKINPRKEKGPGHASILGYAGTRVLGYGGTSGDAVELRAGRAGRAEGLTGGRWKRREQGWTRHGGLVGRAHRGLPFCCRNVVAVHNASVGTRSPGIWKPSRSVKEGKAKLRPVFFFFFSSSSDGETVRPVGTVGTVRPMLLHYPPWAVGSFRARLAADDLLSMRGAM